MASKGYFWWGAARPCRGRRAPAGTRRAGSPRGASRAPSARSRGHRQSRSSRPVRRSGFAQHAEARGDATGRRIREHDNERQAGVLDDLCGDIVRGNCIRLIAPSIIRAPPEPAKMTEGGLLQGGETGAATNASPTAAPIAPPMNSNAMVNTTTRWPPIRPCATVIGQNRLSCLKAA